MLKRYWIVIANIFIGVGVILFIVLYAKERSHVALDWTMIISVSVALILLLVLDITVMTVYNRRLQRSVLEAELANKSKSDFVSNMSHEIRTPITAILGMNEMIQRESEDANVLEYSYNIQKAGTSLLGIINDILDFSKIEAGRMELITGEYKTVELIGDLVNLIHLRAETKGLRLITEVDPMLPEKLVGDELRIKQVIINMLTNAVKYTEKGSVKFEMRIKDFDTDTVTLYIAVTDTGIGIKPEEMDKLFTAFDRLDAKRTRTIEGSGLGLAISRSMLSIMGSRLEVESTYGEGSKFFFTLKQKVADWNRIGKFDAMNYASENKEKKRTHSSFTAPGARIMVVDDTPMNIQVIVGLLKHAGMNIDVAGSGRECIEKFGEAHYDLVFLDYRMPQMDGIETLAELHKTYPEKAASTPIISLTASAVAGDREKMLNAGFTDYLTKPVNISEMEAMMIKYLPDDKVKINNDISDNYTDTDEELNEELAALPKEIRDIRLLNVVKGIEYCGDAEDYMDALEIYHKSIETKAEQIEADLESMDMSAYTLKVHSLKSTSLAIGAEELSEFAKKLELAGKEGDTDTVKKETPELLKMYRSLKESLDKYYKQNNRF